jgi:DNA-binding LacI/PurR family transcriptional regulator
MATSTNNRRRSEPAGRQARGQSRVGTLCDQLRELAVSKGPGFKLPPVREICAQFDTNWITLRSALDQLEAAQVIDRRQGSGIYVSPKIGCKRIHIILGSELFQAPAMSPFWGMLSCLLIREAQNRALVRNEEHRFHMTTARSEEESFDERIAQDIERAGIDAALIIGLNNPADRWMEENGIPSVSYAAGGRYKIAGDDGGFIRALEMLAEKGCRRIGIWNPADQHRPAYPLDYRETLKAPYVAALAGLGLEYIPDLMVDLCKYEPGESYRTLTTFQQQGYHVAQDVFGRADGPKPDGLLILDDMMTSGALVALAELGIEVGRDVRIATNHNTGSPTLFGQEKRLILVETNPRDIVTAAFDLLDDVMGGDVPHELIVRVPYGIQG